MAGIVIGPVVPAQDAQPAGGRGGPGPSGPDKIAPATAPAPEPVPKPVPVDVDKRSVTIWSDGTRIAGDLYAPKVRSAGEKLPAIVICVGTGGTKGHTGRRMGVIFARHGYIALAFDYRGWGESERQLMAVDPQPSHFDANNEMTIKVKALRWQMNYADQTGDIRAAISFIFGEPGVDPKRIALWGSSYGGGLVTWVAGNDPRVKCLAAQVPGMAASMGVGNPARMDYVYELATKQARGETEPVPIETGKLTGTLSRYPQMRRNPVKTIGFNPVEASAKITVPSLFVVAEKDELTDNATVERVQQNIAKRGLPSAYHVIKGITHYGIYKEGFDEATNVELTWFDKYLK